MGQDCENEAKTKIHLESCPHFHCGNFNQQPYSGKNNHLNLGPVFLHPPRNLCGWVAVLSKGPGTLVACAEQLWLNAAAAYIDYLCRADSLLSGADGEGEGRLKVGYRPYVHPTQNNSLEKEMKAGQKVLEA